MAPIAGFHLSFCIEIVGSFLAYKKAADRAPLLDDSSLTYSLRLASVGAEFFRIGHITNSGVFCAASALIELEILIHTSVAENIDTSMICKDKMTLGIK